MDLTKKEKLDQLERLLQSRTLHGSESLKAFLRFVVTKAVENQEGDLKEYTIATEVFGRRGNYDSRNDSVVRVQASRLRSKLQEYYTKEGKDDKVFIDLPKGHYSPVFSYIESTNGSENGEGVAPRVLELSSPPQVGWSRWSNVVIGGLVVLSFVLGYLAFSNRSQAPLVGTSSAKATDTDKLQAGGPLWNDLLGSPEPILVTFSNTLFEGTAETGMKVLKPMDSPERNPDLSAKPSNGAGAEAADRVVTEHYTGTGEVMGVYFLADLFSRAGRSFRVKRSLLLTWEDLKTENIVVLGSPAENLLLRDLPQEQDFVFRLVKDANKNTTLGLVNTKPKPGEQDLYLAKQVGPSRSQISEDYALVSLLRGLDAKHRLLILAGITTFGTQAAAEYVTNPEYLKDLVARLNLSPASEPVKLPAYYQILLKVKVNGGVPVQTSYVTHHAL